MCPLFLNPSKTKGILRKFQKVILLTQNWKIMVPPERLSEYLSNEYQCYGVSISRKITNIVCILILVIFSLLNVNFPFTRLL
jgi:hypothetical protein